MAGEWLASAAHGLGKMHADYARQRRPFAYKLIIQIEKQCNYKVLTKYKPHGTASANHEDDRVKAGPDLRP
jgi:hypothetical protein